MKQITEDASGTEIDLAAGETLEVRLQENRSTGFKWVLESAGEGVCALVGDTFENGGAIPGQSGTHRWEFRAEQAGSATITLSYQRPWEKKQTPGRNFTLRVRVS